MIVNEKIDGVVNNKIPTYNKINFVDNLDDIMDIFLKE